MDLGTFVALVEGEVMIEGKVGKLSYLGALGSQTEGDTRGWGRVGLDSETPGP